MKHMHTGWCLVFELPLEQIAVFNVSCSFVKQRWIRGHSWTYPWLKEKTLVFIAGKSLLSTPNLTQISHLDLSVSVLCIFSDGWADRPDVVEDIEKQALGGMSIKLYSPPIANFNAYYQSLKPRTNTRNPWFDEFWQEKFGCYLPGEDRDPRYYTRCSGKEIPVYPWFDMCSLRGVFYWYQNVLQW